MRFRVEIAVVALGGALGGVARWGVAELIGPRPIATLLVNLLGCLAIGVAARRWRGRSALTWAFAATGVLGGFTTFSTFMVDLADLADGADAGGVAWAVVYALFTVVGGVLATTIARQGPS